MDRAKQQSIITRAISLAVDGLIADGYTPCEYGSDYLGAAQTLTKGNKRILVEIKVLPPLDKSK